MSSSIITVCTRVHAVLSNIHTNTDRDTRIRTRTHNIHTRAQVTSLMDLPETHQGGSEDNGRHRTEEVNVSSEQAIMTDGTQRNKIK